MPTPDDVSRRLRESEMRQDISDTMQKTLVDQMAEIVVSQRNADKWRAESSRRMGLMETSIEENTTMTSELLDIFKAVKGGFKVLGWLGAAAKWVAGIAGAIAGVYAAWHSFNK